MLNSEVRPSTLEGVKRLASQIKKERGIKYSNALDLAAQAASCANYRHALRKLSLTESPPAKHALFLTVYWHSKTSYRSGRETLKIELSEQILDICSKLDLKKVRGFGTLRMAAADHFVGDWLAPAQEAARDIICKAERSLRFMEHTGLRPSRGYRPAYPNGSPESKLPGTDHATKWVDPELKQLILVDEPYNGVSKTADRDTWAREHGWWLRKSSWPGMYFPYRCDLFVATDRSRGYEFDALMAKIDAIPAPLTPESWTGESVPSLEVFVSPAAKTPQDMRRARSKATILPEPSATTLPYTSMFGDSRRRPAGAMPVACHVEIGRIIKSVLNSSYSTHSVDSRMNSLRSTLEDWLSLEIGRGHPNGPEFFDVYYRDADTDGPYAEAAQSRSGLTQILGDIRQKLQEFYPNCAPLRQQLRRVDVSRSLISKMTAAAG
jgi:hypothetical protein